MKLILRSREIDRRERAFRQQLNPASLFHGAPLSRMVGLARAHVSRGRLPPGKDAFASHAHLLEEEWLFVLRGEGVLDLGGEEHPVGPGDFVGFPAGAPAHVLKNRSSEDLVYLMGGESRPLDVVEYPHLGKRFLLHSTEKGTAFYELGTPITPFGPVEEAEAGSRPAGARGRIRERARAASRRSRRTRGGRGG